MHVAHLEKRLYNSKNYFLIVNYYCEINECTHWESNVVILISRGEVTQLKAEAE